MVKHATGFLLLGVFFPFGTLCAQTYAPPADSIDAIRGLYDPSTISNEIFLRTSEDAYGDELQFIYDDIERMASHPVVIGEATWKDLQQIPSLTDLDIYQLLKSRRDSNALGNDVTASSHIFVKRTRISSHQHVSL